MQISVYQINQAELNALIGNTSSGTFSQSFFSYLQASGGYVGPAVVYITGDSVISGTKSFLISPNVAYTGGLNAAVNRQWVWNEVSGVTFNLSGILTGLIAANAVSTEFFVTTTGDQAINGDKSFSGIITVPIATNLNSPVTFSQLLNTSGVLAAGGTGGGGGGGTGSSISSINVPFFLRDAENGTGYSLQEQFVPNNFTITGFAVGFAQYGTDIINGGILSGAFYTRDLDNNQNYIAEFTVDIETYSYVLGDLNIPVQGLSRLGYDLTNGLVGALSMSLSLFGVNTEIPVPPPPPPGPSGSPFDFSTENFTGYSNGNITSLNAGQGGFSYNIATIFPTH